MLVNTQSSAKEVPSCRQLITYYSLTCQHACEHTIKRQRSIILQTIKHMLLLKSVSMLVNTQSSAKKHHLANN